MKLTRYLYSGPQSAVSLRVVEGKSTEVLDVQLMPGKVVSLPAEHDYTRTLLALKHLKVQPVASAPTATTAKKTADDNGVNA